MFLDAVTLLVLVVMIVVAFRGGSIWWLGVGPLPVFLTSAWPVDLTDGYPFPENATSVVTTALFALWMLRGSGRLPVRNAAALVAYLVFTVVGFMLWLDTKRMYGPSVAYGDVLTIDWFLGIVLVGGLPAVALVSTRQLFEVSRWDEPQAGPSSE